MSTTDPLSDDASGGVALLDAPESTEAVERAWVTIVWDDPVNLMSYVVYVFSNYFGFERTEAERLMLLVHTQGKAVVAHGCREEMERHVQAMHSYGLLSTAELDA
ncbi:MAG: ATP-dependent Clp protease adapter ClpS [Propionibacteriaceae bacterium]|jgi:ATP-dependent Clp protease adaptor protein ClpS|nr:ATP-dependent Clp protease adapter ClpS [Propionibacteriaceae bacterium]